MGLIHIPRVVYSIAKGLHRQTPGSLVGLGPNNPHIYEARAGLFDIDSYGHMNNASYLTHAELARWELSASNGLMKSMYNSETQFMVAASSIRYRRELRPLFRKFNIETYIGALDDRNIWMYQTFRYPEKDNNRIRAQLLVQAVTVCNRKVVDPRQFLKDVCGYDADLIDSITRPHSDKTVEEMFERFAALDNTFRVAASEDDRLRGGNE